jgi:hypothetical protein
MSCIAFFFLSARLHLFAVHTLAIIFILCLARIPSLPDTPSSPDNLSLYSSILHHDERKQRIRETIFLACTMSKLGNKNSLEKRIEHGFIIEICFWRLAIVTWGWMLFVFSFVRFDVDCMGENGFCFMI